MSVLGSLFSQFRLSLLQFFQAGRLGTIAHILLLLNIFSRATISLVSRDSSLIQRQCQGSPFKGAVLAVLQSCFDWTARKFPPFLHSAIAPSLSLLISMAVRVLILVLYLLLYNVNTFLFLKMNFKLAEYFPLASLAKCKP
jgi:hypothetical protein